MLKLRVDWSELLIYIVSVRNKHSIYCQLLCFSNQYEDLWRVKSINLNKDCLYLSISFKTLHGFFHDIIQGEIVTILKYFSYFFRLKHKNLMMIMFQKQINEDYRLTFHPSPTTTCRSPLSPQTDSHNTPSSFISNPSPNFPKNTIIIQPDSETHPSWISRIQQRYSLGSDFRKKREPTLIHARKKTSKENTDQTIRSFSQPKFKKLLREWKVENMVKTYCVKMKRGLVRRKPIEVQVEENSWGCVGGFKEWISKKEGGVMSNIQATLLAVLGILAIVLLSLAYSFSMVFPEFDDNHLLKITQFLALLEFTMEMLVKFVVKRYESGEALMFVYDIAVKYLKSDFIVDILNITFLAIDIFMDHPFEFRYFRWITILKLPQIFSKLQIIQNMYITTFYLETYWGLFQVILTNFTLAHILSIILNAMASLNYDQNWLKVKGLSNATSAEKYVWGYYWGTTIMLTVGFGDLAATNYSEALCLIFIEMLSCIILAYNINCVGNMIKNLRAQSQEKNNNLKTFQLMARANNLTQELQNKVNNYIEESFMLKNQFNFQKQDELLAHLPIVLRKDYLKSVNRRIFRHLSFIRDLTLESQTLLAEKIVRQITHPDEVIFQQGDICKLVVLRKGILGMMMKTSTRTQPIETLESHENSKSKLLSLGFIKQRRLPYTLKSLTYSILYWIENEDLQNYLRQSVIDHEYFCYERDRFQIKLDEQQLYQCSDCKGQYHSKIACPRLHYIPIQQIIIFKYIRATNLKKQVRKYRKRTKQCEMRALLDNSIIRQELGLLRSSVMNQSVLQLQRSAMQPISIVPDECITVQMPGTMNGGKRSTLEDMEISYSKQQIFSGDQQNSGQPNMIIQIVNNEATAQFWDVQSDTMYNWRHYFPNDNAQQIQFRKKRKKLTL